MKTFNPKISLLTLLVFIWCLIPVTDLLATTRNDPHLPISHCYHWLEEVRTNKKFLTFKYNHAKKNNGEVTFYTDGSNNGAVAGPGLYCAKAPTDSYTYGDRIIRLDLVDDVVMLDELSGKQYCGHKGNFYPNQADCNKQPWDIKFYAGGGKGQFAWYVIRNPNAVKMWSANDDDLIADLKLNRDLDGSGFQNQVDATIAMINAERTTLGTLVWTNSNARLGLISILQDDNLRSKIPPLSLIEQIYSSTDAKLDKAIKATAYTKEFARALRDTLLSYNDFKATVDKDDVLKNSFVSVLQDFDYNQLNNDKININLPILMSGLDLFGGAVNLGDLTIDQIWKKTLKSNTSLSDLLKILPPKGKFINAFAKNIPSLDQVLSTVPEANLPDFLKLLDTYVTTGKPLKDYSVAILANVLEKNDFKFIGLFDSLKNPLLEKDAAAKEIFEKLSATGFKNINPVFAGHFYERAVSVMTDNEKQQYLAQMSKLEIPQSSRVSFLMLDDYKKDSIKLPNNLSRAQFLTKLVKRSIGERVAGKTSTNTFRMIFTDIFRFFYDDFKVKKLGTADAVKFYSELIDSFTDEQKKSYSYISLQNAMLFSANVSYKDHPMEEALRLYQSGNTQFDKLLETVTEHAYDGSYLQMLINRAGGDANAKKLLDIYIQGLLSTSFDQYIASPEFTFANIEKSFWANNVKNPEYTKSDKNIYVKSDMCHISAVLIDKAKLIDKLYDAATIASLKTKDQLIYKSFCKSK